MSEPTCSHCPAAPCVVIDGGQLCGEHAAELIAWSRRMIASDEDRKLGALLREWVAEDSPDDLDRLATVLAGPNFLRSEKSPVVVLVRAVAATLRRNS